MLDNKLKHLWDVWIMGLLFFVTFTVPVRLAFYETDSDTWKFLNTIVDLNFFVDIVLCFFSSYLDD